MDVISNNILPMLQKLTSDEIPNIRFNVAKTYGVLIGVLRRLPDQGTIYTLEQAKTPFSPSPRGQQLIEEQIMPSLVKLADDKDVDVRFFAKTAMATGENDATAAAGSGGEPMNTSP